MANADHLKRLADRAEHLVQRSLEQHVTVSDRVLIAGRARSLALRCVVIGRDGVKTVVVKQYNEDDERAFTDWASLLFLSEYGGRPGNSSPLVRRRPDGPDRRHVRSGREPEFDGFGLRSRE